MEESLFAACRDGRHQEVQRLLEQGANANHVVNDLTNDSYRETPLIAAAAFGNVRCVELLLQRRADPNVQSVEGWTALHWSAYAGSAPVADMLCRGGADASIRDGQGKTALDVARKHKHAAVVALLADDSAEKAAATAAATGDRSGARFQFELVPPSEWAQPPFRADALPADVAASLRRWGVGEEGAALDVCVRLRFRTAAAGGGDGGGRSELDGASLSQFVTDLFRCPQLMDALPLGTGRGPSGGLGAGGDDGSQGAGRDPAVVAAAREPSTAARRRAQSVESATWRPLRTSALHLSLFHRLRDAGVAPADFKRWLERRGGALGSGGATAGADVGAGEGDGEAEGEDGPPPLDHAFTPAEADQFLFHVLKRLVLGGRGNAPDAGWEPYLDATRALFRRLLRLRRRDGAVHVSSLVLQVVDVDADFKLFGSAFGGGDVMSAHSVCYAIVEPHPDPAQQVVTVWHHSLASQVEGRDAAPAPPVIGWGR